MVRLKLGKITNPEIANWFNISERTYNRQKKSRLMELENYCAFRINPLTLHNIEIREIYVEKYEGIVPKALEEIYKQIGYICCKGGVYSILDIKREVRDKLKEKNIKVTKNGFNVFIYKALKDQLGYGKNASGNGKIGSYVKYWGIKEGNIYRKLTEEELKEQEKDDKLIIAGIFEEGKIQGKTVTEIAKDIGIYKGSSFSKWKRESKAEIVIEVKIDLWKQIEALKNK